VQAQDDAGGQQTYEWRWGARAQSEVGEKAVAAFVAEFKFMVQDERWGMRRRRRMLEARAREGLERTRRRRMR
jgi:hypothetical protein